MAEWCERLKEMEPINFDELILKYSHKDLEQNNETNHSETEKNNRGHPQVANETLVNWNISENEKTNSNEKTK